MSKTLVSAKEYVAQIIGGGANSQESLDMASESILRGYAEWQTKKFWRFLLKDTSNRTFVTGCNCVLAATTVTAPSSGAFDMINVGQTVTVDTGATLAAETTVTAYTRSADGTIATITLSNAFGGVTNATAILTFSADIPIIAGTNDYNLPADFNAPFTAMFTETKRTLTWRDQRYWDRMIQDQTVNGFATDYTTYNPQSELSQNFGTKRLKFNMVPDTNDTMRLRYYRSFNTSGTYVDMPDEYLYIFLDYCRNILLATKKAQDDPQAYAASVAEASEGALEDDEQATDDDDVEQCMKSQFEMGNWNRQIWGNGEFDPTR